MIEKIPVRDKEVILLTTVFFWAKYQRRKIGTEDFTPTIPNVDMSDPIAILTAGFDILREAHSDRDGSAVEAVAKMAIDHPSRVELFPHLIDKQIRTAVGVAEGIFENQEECAWCEGWSHYDQANPGEFAIEATGEALRLAGRQVGVPWFEKIDQWKDREAIIKAVSGEKLPHRLGGLSTKQPLPKALRQSI